MRIVLLGAPGSGKGTQAKLLQKHLGLPHISTGDLFRQAVRQKTELGLKASAYMDRGELVPDEVVTDMVEERLKAGDTAGGFLLDGYPRNNGQADALEGKLREMGRPLQHVVYLEVSAEEVVRRLSSRRVCKSCGRVQPVAATGPEQVLAALEGAAESVEEVKAPAGLFAWRLTVASRAQLNSTVDRLRAAGVEIEAIEAVRSSLEDVFLQAVESASDTSPAGDQP